MYPVTVVIPTFNRAKFLARAIKSVQKQSYSNWKLIIVDNASKDNTSSLVYDIMRTDRRISYYCHVENIGMLANWAFGISQVETPFFCILCDDDILLPNFLKTAIQEMITDEEIGMCFGVTEAVDNKGNYLGTCPSQMAKGYYPAGEGAIAMLISQHPASTGTLFRSKSVHLVGGFDQLSHYLADLDLMLRIALKYPIKYFGEKVALYFIHPEKSLKDLSYCFPGLLNMIRNIKKISNTNRSYCNRIYIHLNRNFIFPLLVQMTFHPVKMYRITDIASVFKSVVESHQTIRMLTLMPFYIFKNASLIIISGSRRLLRKILRYCIMREEEQKGQGFQDR